VGHFSSSISTISDGAISVGTFLYRVFTFIAFFFVASGIISVLLMEFGPDNGVGLIAGLPIVLPFIIASPLIYLLGWTIRWISGAPATTPKWDRKAVKRSLPGAPPPTLAASRPKPAEQLAPLRPPP
jgi:hypothetical protein